MASTWSCTAPPPPSEPTGIGRRGEDAPVIGVVARYEILKGIQCIIPAFRRLLEDFPDAKLVLANAYGHYAHQIRRLLRGMLPDHSYCEIQFEPDPVALYSSFDVFVHTPLVAGYEAFGQVYVEALAAGLPSVFTPSGIAAEFITDQLNAHLVPFQDSDAILSQHQVYFEQPRSPRAAYRQWTCQCESEVWPGYDDLGPGDAVLGYDEGEFVVKAPHDGNRSMRRREHNASVPTHVTGI